MIKSLFLPLLAGAVLLGATTGVQAQQFKVGTVDMKQVFEKYYKTKDAEQRINEDRNAAKKDMEEKMDRHKKLVDEVTKLKADLERPELSKEAKSKSSALFDQKAENLKDMENQIRQFEADKQRELQETTMRMRSGIVDEINKVISDIVKANQFDLVLDRSGLSTNMVPVVLYARDSYDFSTEVVTALNKNKSTSDDSATTPPAAASTPKPAATTAPANAGGKKNK